MQKNDFIIVTPPLAPIGKQLIDCLKKFNYKVGSFNDRLNFFNNKIGKIFSWYKKFLLKRMNNNFFRLVKKTMPKFIIVIKGKELNPDVLNKVRQLNIKTICYFPEYISHWRSMNYLAPFYDYFIVSCHYVKKYAEGHGFKNFYYQPFGAAIEKNVNYPQTDKYLYDITFIGSVNNEYYPERVEFLSALKDYDLNIWGNKNWLDTPLKKYYHDRPSDEEMYRIYSYSKIVINIDYHKEPIDGVNIRPFEATACGSLLINDAISPEIFKLFKENEEFLAFSNKEELKDKIDYYLKHEDERLAIAKAGFERTRQEHTWDDRVRELLKLIKYEDLLP